MRDPLQPFFEQQGVVILDGGLATLLEARGESLDDPLWSAALLLDRPERVAAAHGAFLDAGADCIISASYQASFEGLARRGLSVLEAERILRLSVEIALEARRSFWERRPDGNERLRPLVAASVGPYGAFLADGSEFRGDYGLGVDDLVSFHRRRLDVLARAGADLLAIETIPSLVEARALVEILGSEPGPPAWMSFSCRDGAHLRDGTPLSEAVEEAGRSPRIVAVGVNCTAPRFIDSLLARASAVARVPLVVYPNSGERWDARAKRWLPDQDGDPWLEQCRAWRDRGARLIGGCCRIGPIEIARLRADLLE